MQKTPIRYMSRCALAAVFLATLATTASAGSFTRGCAARDMQILQFVEEQASVKPITELQRSETLNAIMHARIVCYEGYIMDGLAIYDGIAKRVMSEKAKAGYSD